VSVYIETSKLNDECFVRVHAIGTQTKYWWKKGRSNSERQPHDITSCKLVNLNSKREDKKRINIRISHGLPRQNALSLDVTRCSLVWIYHNFERTCFLHMS
jgi:hypothetical protein